MVGARERRRLGLVLAAALALGACSPGSRTVSPADGRARAEWLASSYARHVGAGDRGLDPAGDLAMGESGLHYERGADVLIGRAFVQRAHLAGSPPAEAANLRRMVGALNDPRVGGMFDRGGGTFVLDEGRDGYFLVRAFPIATTDPDQLAAGMDRLVAVAAPWLTTWFYQVAMIMHGHQAPPTHFTALEDRPR